ncbi:MAG: alanyl-tRNA editing protein [Rhizobiales bacterium 65-9]|nr:alanyl-tRNA editing protein [Hyphomicrobiales bacterium]OJY36727.1 MAG: alanyl-tRNA editing protein [Rhizobiales bacterium 65-9]
MGDYFCLEHPETLVLATEARDARPGAVLLAAHPFYPGGGGQLPDRGTLAWSRGEVAIASVTPAGEGAWIELAEPAIVSGPVEARVDAGFRRMMRELHTDLHLLNALVFQHFDGALVTGVQMNDDGSARIDFDLPAADNDRLRRLEGPLNDLIAQDLKVSAIRVPAAAAQAEKGLVRSRSVAPPPSADGAIRVVEIAGVDRQACGGTHLSSTGESRPIRILKIDNKGRHNRRIRIGLD